MNLTFKVVPVTADGVSMQQLCRCVGVEVP